MAEKKEADETNQVEGRENFDYTVPNKRKKVCASETELNHPSLKLTKKETINSELLEWIKDQIERSINMFDSTKHWTPNLEKEVKKLCLVETIGLKLFVWVNQDQVFFDIEVPKGITLDTAVIFKICI